MRSLILGLSAILLSAAPAFAQLYGGGQDYMGGWGTAGDQSTAWAITNESAYNQFTPPAPPTAAPADLYAGCSGDTVRTVLDEADGLVLWGGFKTIAPAGPLLWDENAPWWVTIKARLTDKRRTG